MFRVFVDSGSSIKQEEKELYNVEIIPLYAYKTDNLEKLISMTDEKYHKQMRVYDNLDPAIACHRGPNAFGYIFVKGE